MPTMLSRRSALLGSLAIVAALLIPVPAQATPPTILSVSQTDRHPSVTWSLPVGGTAETVEIASAPPVGTDGRFFAENIKAFATFYDASTTWLSSSQLDPGTYYVHVSGTDPSLDPECPVCAPREYSSVIMLVIPVPTLMTKVAVKARVDCLTRRVGVESQPVPFDAESMLGRTKLVLGGKGYHKTVLAKASSTIYFKLKPGRYTLTAQYAGHSDSVLTYRPSNVVVKHFTIKKGC